MPFVQISKDFWTNVHTHEDLIRRCFYSIFKRFPLREGRKSAYNLLLINMRKEGSNYGGHVTVDVFHKYNEAEAVGYNYQAMVKRGLTPKQIDDRVTRRAAKRGINVVKLFEQYIYKWVEKIMYTEWLRERNHITRTSYSSSYDTPSTAFLERRRVEGYSSWQGTQNEMRGHYGSTWIEKIDKKLETHNIKAPTIQDRGMYVSEYTLGVQDDNTAADNLKSRIKNLIKTDIERKVVQLCLEDLNGKDIAKCLGITTQYVSLLRQKIRERCVQHGVLSS